MGYKINLGSWGSVFAVPSDVVDKYIKIAGGSSVKVLLYFLRHSGRELDAAEIAQALYMKEEDVSDAFIFWEQQGLLKNSGGEYLPAADNSKPDAVYEQATFLPLSESKESDLQKAQLAVTRAAALRSPEFSPSQIADTVKADDKLNYLFKVCEKLYGRPLKHAEQNALVTITEHIGLPAEVALMLVDYCFLIGKTSPAYMKTAAMDWVEKEVTTLSEAEEYVSKLQTQHNAENTVKSLFGLDRAMSQKEKDFSALWINEWGFSPDVIKAAYDININAKGKCSFPYISKVLENWYEKGISTVEQVNEERKNGKTSKNSSLDVSAVYQSVLDDYKKGE
ncbi:MAG: DnaD domain protein [Eubacterium sp.]|nr:DnaD domain protein [Eubacterium sp.]